MSPNQTYENQPVPPPTGQSGRLGPFSSRGQTGELRSPGTWGEDPGGPTPLRGSFVFLEDGKTPVGKVTITMEMTTICYEGDTSSNGVFFFFELSC